MEDEPTILNHYNLTTLYPTAWPAEKDESDASDEDVPGPKKVDLRRSKSRYSALERSGSDRRSLVPGSQKIGNGVENLVQKDEMDPLGGTESVVRILREKGMPVEEDSRLREESCSHVLCPQLIDPRKQILTIIYHFLANLVPLPSPCECFNPVTTARPRFSFALHRPEVRITKGPGRVKF